MATTPSSSREEGMLPYSARRRGRRRHSALRGWIFRHIGFVHNCILNPQLSTHTFVNRKSLPTIHCKAERIPLAVPTNYTLPSTNYPLPSTNYLFTKCGSRDNGAFTVISFGPSMTIPSSAFHVPGGRMTLRSRLPFSMTGATRSLSPIMNSSTTVA